MIKYIAYCRKSLEDEGRQILSIISQQTEIKEFAKRENLDIVAWFTEAKTAKKPGREKFEEMMKRIESGKADGIIAWNPDRLARNSVDGGRIIYDLDTGKIKDLKFPTFWFDNTPQGKFMLSIAFCQSKYYVDNLSENVRRGQRQKLRNGVYPFKAPFGYVNNPKTRGIDIDPVTSKIVQEMFSMFVQGNCSFTAITHYLKNTYGLTKKNGKHWHIDTIKHHLSNKFYTGIITMNDEYYEGTHETFISKELFTEAQTQIKRISRPQKGGHSFAFTSLARCGNCGAAITAETHTKHYPRTGRTMTYNYYRCTRKLKPCDERPVTELEVENQLRKILENVSLPQSWANQWSEWIDRDEITEKQSAATTIQKMKLELAEIDRKANILLDSYLDQIVDAETFKKKKNQFFEEKIQLQEMIGKLEAGGLSWIEPMKEFIKTASECEKIARAKNNCEDIGIFAKRVGSNFFLSDRRLPPTFRQSFAAVSRARTARALENVAATDSFRVGATRFERATTRPPAVCSTN